MGSGLALPPTSRQDLLTGFGIVLASADAQFKFGDLVRLHKETNLAYKINAAETNAGPRWVNNPYGCLYDINGDSFEHSPFVAVVDSYQIVSFIADYEDFMVEGEIPNINKGGRGELASGQRSPLLLS